MGILDLHITIILLFLASNVSPQEKHSWQLELLPGIAVVASMPLIIHQNNHPELSIMAHYRTKSLQLPPYYSYRLSTFKDNKGWSLEMNHLKIYLTNTSSEIEQFSVSHGYNQLFLNRHYLKDRLAWLIGAGAIIGHPESTIRDQQFEEKGGLFNDGYYLAGKALQGAVQYHLVQTTYFILPVEAKLSFGYGKVPVVDGHAHVPIIAFHLLSGIGLNL